MGGRDCGWEPGASRAEQGSGGLGSRLHRTPSKRHSWIWPESGSHLNPLRPRGEGRDLFLPALCLLSSKPHIPPFPPPHPAMVQPQSLCTHCSCFLRIPSPALPLYSAQTAWVQVPTQPYCSLTLGNEFFTSLLSVLNFPTCKMQMVMTLMISTTKLMRIQLAWNSTRHIVRAKWAVTQAKKHVLSTFNVLGPG